MRVGAGVGYAGAMLALFLLACAPVDCDVEDSGVPDSGATGAGGPHSVDASGLPKSWTTDEYWAENPLSPIVLPDTVPTTRHWQIRIATSPDRRIWTPDPRVIAYGLSSLDLLVAGDWVVIAGMLSPEQNDTFPDIVGPYTIPAIASKDLVSWGSQTWTIGDGTHEFLVDPSLQLGSDGVLRATWFGHSEPDVDPALIEGSHLVYRAPWSDTGTFVQDGLSAAYYDEWLVDPVVCEMDGTPWLFYTYEGESIRAADSLDGGTRFQPVDGFSWDGPSVPYCLGGETGMLLIGQERGGLYPPRVADVLSNEELIEKGLLFVESPWGEYCTSPVLGFVNDQWLLVCAVEVNTG